MEKYFAGAPKAELAQLLLDRIRDYYAILDEGGRYALWRRAQRAYYGVDQQGSWSRSSAVTYGGAQGELVLLKLNHYRSLMQSVHTLVTGSRPAVGARAATDDNDAAEQTMLAERLVEWYFKSAKMEDVLRLAAMYALRWGEGWVQLLWDTQLGKPFAANPDTQQIVYEGDAVAHALRPIDVIRDVDCPVDGRFDPQWLITRTRVSRWDIASQFPEHYDKICNLAPASNDMLDVRLWKRGRGRQSEDYVHMFHFFHKKCTSIPEGRDAMLVGDTILSDGPLPYKSIPVHHMWPDQEDDAPFGFSPFFDLLGPQDALDSVVSTAASNHDAFGVQNIWTPRGDSLTANDLTGGLRHLESNAKPEPIQLTAVAEDSYRLHSLYKQEMETIIGVNSVARGDPQESLKSGAALALIQSMSVQHNSGIHAAYARLTETVGSALLEVLQSFVSQARLTDLAGNDLQSSVTNWTGKDIDKVSRVVVELSNPILQTAAGRKEVASTLMDKGLVRTTEQFFAVLETGRVEPLYRYERAQIRLMRDENERMRGGETVFAAKTDRHRLHIQEHAVLLSDHNVRFDQALATAIMEHIQEHETLLAMSNPMTLEAIGEPPAMQQMPMPEEQGPPPPGGGKPPAPRAELPGAEQVAAVSPSSNGSPLPSMPMNPLTGTRMPTGPV